MGVAVQILGQSARIPPRVAPRVRDESGLPTRVEIAVAEALGRGKAFIGLLGTAGSGRTTALELVRAALGRSDVEFLDDAADAEQAATPLPAGKVARVFTSGVATVAELEGLSDVVLLRLQPWGLDELIEWALAEPADERRAFVARATPLLGELSGSSVEVLAAAWGAVGREPGLRSTQDVLLAAASHAGLDVSPDSAVAQSAVLIMTDHHTSGWARSTWRGMLRHVRVVEAIGLRRVLHRLESGCADDLNCSWPDGIRAKLGKMVASSPVAQQTLERTLAADALSPIGANAVSLLRYAGSPWRPGSRPVVFTRAYLAKAPWAGVRLHRACLIAAQLRAADLARAMLRGANAEGAEFDGATLRGAVLEGCIARGASFRSCDLRDAKLGRARLDAARFQGTDLSGAELRAARGIDVDFRGAKLVRADASRALFEGASVSGASLMGPNWSVRSCGGSTSAIVRSTGWT